MAAPADDPPLPMLTSPDARGAADVADALSPGRAQAAPELAALVRPRVGVHGAHHLPAWPPPFADDDAQPEDKVYEDAERRAAAAIPRADGAWRSPASRRLLLTP